VNFFQTYDFPGDDTPVIRGSALLALERRRQSVWEEAVVALVDALDTYIPEPVRAIDQAILNANRRRILNFWSWYSSNWPCRAGIVKVGEEVEIVGIKDTVKHCTGVEMFRKLLDEGRAGENCGVLLTWY
jgi:elongation factor Tu